MSIKPLLALIGFLGWSVLCTQWYCCWMQVACESCGAEAYAAYNTPPVVPIATTKTAVPVAYEWAKAQLNDADQLRELEERIKAGMEADNILEITGLYFEEEPQPEGVLNLGLARADQLKEYLLSNIPPERVRTKSRLVSEPEGVREKGFYGIEFKWLDPDQTMASTLEQFADRVIIRFPYNSVQKDYDPEVDGYLMQLAERVQESGEKIQVTGHTDDAGEEDYNLKLGQQRAESIQSFLEKAGVGTEQIKISSKGEKQPVVPNDTDENRHANRRVEVVLVSL